jgi:hypothetical protein
MGKHLKKSALLSIHQAMHWLIAVFAGVLICPESAFAQQDTDMPIPEKS